MVYNLIKKIFLYNSLIILFNGCAYFNTFYNANQYYEEATKIRLGKDGQAVPITAMDKYGKSIAKCKKVLKDFPQSKLRLDAILLMAKAQYFRTEYDLALDNLDQILSGGSKKLIEEAKYYKALCKWKKGNLQTSINELNSLLSNSKSKTILSKCHLSLAEISTELLYPDSSLFHLKKAAKITQNRDEKGIIYGRLAELAFDLGQYEIAMNGYSNVVAHSLSKEKIENAHLQMLKILRIQKNYKLASRKIKALLADDKFKRISGNLELELVNLYRAQGEYEEIQIRLESIANDYQRTQVSAEAYYQLGQLYTSVKWDLEKAKQYFEKVSKESNKSIFTSSAKTKRVSVAMPLKSLPELYYQLADLEAFSFSRYNESIKIFEKIILEYPDSNFKPKSIFALIFIFEQLNDSIKVESTRNLLLQSYPDSEYTSYLIGGKFSKKDDQSVLFKKSEEISKIDQVRSLEKFKTTLRYDINSSLAAPAAFFIGYHYDQESNVDSALKYYQFLVDEFPKSDQSNFASQRISNINHALALIKADSTTSPVLVPN